jgi:hypothetical protein
MRARWTAAALAAGAVAGSVSGIVFAASATAAACSAVTIGQGRGLTFDVSSVYVAYDSCVAFANLTDVTVTVKVSGTSFSERLPAKTPASASGSVTVTKGATVTASDGVRTGRGSISVEPKPSPTPTHVPPPVKSVAPATPAPTKSSATPSSSPSSTPTKSATPASQTHTHQASTVAGLPTLPSFPPGGADAPPAASHPVVAPRVKGGSASAVSATVVEPASGPRRGLPAAVAAVVVLGLLTAYGRAVLAAAPVVDSRSARRPSHP